MGDDPQRLRNMETQQQKVDTQLEKVDAVVGKNLNLDEIDSFRPHDENSFSKKPENIKREVGCYMSNMKIYEMIRKRRRN